MDHERDLDLAVLRVAWRLDALDEWRKQVEHRLGTLEDSVDVLTETDKIARAVAARVNDDRRLVLTGMQKLGATLMSLVILADAIRGLI